MSDGSAPIEATKHWAEAVVDSAISGIAKTTDTTKSGLKPYVEGGGAILGNYASAGVLGMLLGACDATIGPEPGGWSIDGGLAVGFGLVSIASAGKMPGLSSWAKTQGTAMTMGYTRRKTAGLMAGGGSSTPSGGGGSSPTKATSKPQTPEEDPIIAKSKEFA